LKNAQFLAALILISTLLGCSGNGLFSGKKEGQIIYDVTFPFEENSLLLELYPREMVFEFKDDRFHTTLKSSYGVISTEFIVDNDEGTFTQLLKSFSEKSFFTLDKEEMKVWMTQYPGVRFEKTGITDSIAGFLCEKTIAHFLNDSVPAIELYHTKAIKIDHSNWWNQFSEIDGFLLAYEVEQYGKRMRLKAREISYGPIAEERFEIQTEYQLVTSDAMKAKISSLMMDFMQ